jgi:hypothetical protein
MNQPGIGNIGKGSQKFVPDETLAITVIGPKAMFDSVITASNADADQIVKIAIRETFDIQINRRAIQLWVKDIDDVYLVLADSERTQRVMKSLLLALRMSAGPPRAKSVRQLRNREDALAMQLLALLL